MPYASRPAHVGEVSEEMQTGVETDSETGVEMAGLRDLCVALTSFCSVWPRRESPLPYLLVMVVMD
jgi:hypothetical protein